MVGPVLVAATPVPAPEVATTTAEEQVSATSMGEMSGLPGEEAAREGGRTMRTRNTYN
jgi:hypothetical protein